MYLLISLTYFQGFRVLFGWLSMPLFNIYLFFRHPTSFIKLMGTGKNGTFDVKPDFNMWATLSTWDDLDQMQNFIENDFISRYNRFFGKTDLQIIAKTYTTHGLWDAQTPFKATAGTPPNVDSRIGVLTRASIRPSKVFSFWRNVPAVAVDLSQTPGLLKSIGIGEVPFFKQATFSIWENETAMKAFAYKQKEHSEVIRKTRKENWYSEDLFARFEILQMD